MKRLQGKNPWHGCHRSSSARLYPKGLKKVSEGCQHCYMYFLDGKRGIDTSHIFRTENFSLPVQKNRAGQFKIPSGMTLYVGLSTDFFLEEASRDAQRRSQCE